jgi:hypothetical protein
VSTEQLVETMKERSRIRERRGVYSFERGFRNVFSNIWKQMNKLMMEMMEGNSDPRQHNSTAFSPSCIPISFPLLS